MKNRIHSLISDQQGVASVMVALSIAALMGLTALAVDLGQAYLKRGELQTAADAGALAGANSLLAEGEDHTDLRTIVTNYVHKNLVEADQPAVALTDSDIVFMRDGVPTNYDANQVEVTVTLSSERKNALSLHFGKLIGVPTMDIQVVARAGVVGMCSSKCVKPFVVPTKFTWDDQAAMGTSFANNGQLDTDSPEEIASVEIQGYNQNDMGTQIIIKPGDPKLTIAPGQYNLVDLPPVNKGTPITGADAVRENIAGCTGSSSTHTVGPGDELNLEPGNSKGPVAQGTTDLIGQDPYAHWNSTTKSIEGSLHSDPLDSPRVAIMAFYDPRQPPISGRNSIFVYELGAFFIESVDNLGNVTARFINTVAVDPDSMGDDCLLKISRMLLDSSRL